jgi:hypothetical protein
VRATTTRVRSYLDPTAAQLDYLSRKLGEGRFDHRDTDEVADLLTGALAATPQVAALIFVRADLKATAVDRATGAIFDRAAIDRVTLEAAMREARNATGPAWGRLVHPPTVDKTMINLRQPVRTREGHFLGVLAAAVPISGVSSFIAGDDGLFGPNAFILYGRDHVLAHRQLEQDYPELDTAIPLPRLNHFSDVVLASIWDRNTRSLAFLDEIPDFKGHTVEVGNIP